MALSTERTAIRDRLILCGLYLSKYDSLALKELGFESFVEAFNILGYAMGSKPASIKNYRDEFDPLFPNSRKGWHKRPIRAYCLKLFEENRDLDFESFTSLIKSFFGVDRRAWSESEEEGDQKESESHFAKRLITGLAAEHYFETVYSSVPEFGEYAIENTTRLGCGYDFRFRREPPAEFLAVEVKGLNERKGNLTLTPKEHEVAGKLQDRFYLFVVRNFQESPFHEIFQNPISGSLQFRRIERVVIHVSWLTSL
jgi:hypothetical protein